MGKPNTGRAGDGVTLVGKRKGKQVWRARLYWIDSRTGKTCEKRVTFEAPSKAQALMRREQELAKARGDAVDVTERVKFSDVSKAWFATIMVRSTQHSWGAHRRALDAHFGKWWLDMVTTRAMQDHLSAMVGSPGYVNSRRDVLRHVFDFAVSKSWAASNPARDLKRRSTRATGAELEDAPRKALTVDEASAVLADLRELEPEVYPVCLTQLVLGCRFAEVSALRRDDVDLESGIVRVRRGQWGGAVGPTKGRYARTAGLPLDARAMLREHFDRMAVERWPSWDVLVFPRPAYGRRKHSDHWSYTTVAGALRRSFARLGLDVQGLTHVWRHTLVTMASEHASSQVLRRVVGHLTQDMHQRYQHAHDAEVIVLAEVVGRQLGLTGAQTGARDAKPERKPRK